jgi:hypothetical protein
MKLNKYIAFGALFAGLVSFAQGQVVVNITGATAFRDAAHNTIVALMQENGGTALRARANITLPGGTSASNLRIYKGTIDGVLYTIRCTFSGSTQGILDLADQNAIHYLKTDTAVANNNDTTSLVLNTNTETAASDMAFSDVDKLLSARPNANLGGGPVGVVPFMFVGGVNIPSGATNMTDQIHNTLWSLGSIPASVMSGVAGDATTLLYATGRNNGSGTRASILSETRYGSFNSVVQYNGTLTGSDGSGTVGSPTLFLSSGNPDPNGGHTSNSTVKSMVTRTPPANTVYVSYLTVSDALTATGYNETTGLSSGGEGAKALTYNGVRYSPANVNSGAYTLWGAQQLYIKDGASQAINDFFADLEAGLQNATYLGTAGLPTSGLAVERTGGDGGSILPLE